MDATMKPIQFGRLVLWLSAIVIIGCASHKSPEATTEVKIDQINDLSHVATAARKLARQYGTDNVLVAFDLDNTLLAMRTPLGSDQWYDWQRELQAADACAPQLVADRLAAQGALFHVGAMRPTQVDSADLVRSLQDDGFPTMIVTARGHDFRLPTFRELRRNRLNFRDATIGPRGGIEASYTPQDASRPVRFEDGVYMLAGQHKGQMLLALFKQLEVAPPAAVVFVDDKAKNVEAMYQALLDTDISAELFLYTREATDKFPTEQSAAQWQYLEPALMTIQRTMGTQNFQLPEPSGTASVCDR